MLPAAAFGDSAPPESTAPAPVAQPESPAPAPVAQPESPAPAAPAPAAPDAQVPETTTQKAAAPVSEPIVALDEPSEDGLAVTVESVTAGGLQAAVEGKLAQLGQPLSALHKIVATGTVNNSDLSYIQSLRTSNVKEVDLGGCAVDGELTTTIGDYDTNIGNTVIERIVMPQQGATYDLPYDYFRSCLNLKYADVSHVKTFGARLFYASGIEEVVFPSGCTLSDTMFGVCSSLKYLDLSNVSGFSYRTFYGAGLESVTMPTAPYATPNCLFELCPSLKSIDLSNAVSLGTQLFLNNEALESVKMPSVPYVLPYWIFYGCKNLKTIDLSNASSLAQADAAFRGSGLESVVMPETFALSTEMFKQCGGLKSFDASGCTSFGPRVFSESGLTDIVMPEAFALSDALFQDCKNLKSFDASGCTAFGGAAFSGSGLASIIMPASYALPASLFANCSSLEYFDASPATSIGAGAFAGSGIKSIKLPDSYAVPDSLFANTTALRFVDLRGATSFGSLVFSYSAVKLVLMPEAPYNVVDGTSTTTGTFGRAFSGMSVVVPDLAHYNAYPNSKTQVNIVKSDIIGPVQGVDEGGTLQLVAIPQPPTPGYFDYQWYLNGTAIEGATGPNYVKEGFTAADAGTYSFSVLGVVMPTEKAVALGAGAGAPVDKSGL
ncbi:MAG: leucine-rich repeat protein, partial [Coriobacteriales bacterium]|nr:leucine-rich repeat protein [Coriobacteriales bacterium]